MNKLNLLRPLGWLLLRLAMGAALMAHGYPKLFDSQPFLASFPQMGFPSWTVYVAGTVEFFGGLLLVLGLFSRYAAFFVSGEMFIAFLAVHWKFGSEGYFAFLGHGRDEFPLLLAVAAFLLLAAGAGKLSLDYLIFREKA